MGILFGLFTSLVWSIGIFPFALATRFYGSNTINTIRLLMAVVLLTLVIIVSEGTNWQSLVSDENQQAIFWLGASGIVGLALGDYFSFNAFKHIGARLSSIFSTLAPAAAMATAFIITGETINAIGISGMVITIFGVSMIQFLRKQPDDQYQLNFIGTLNALIAATCQGVGVVFSKIAMINAGVSISAMKATFIRILVAMIALYLLSLFNGRFFRMHKEFLHSAPKAKLYLLLGTLFGLVIGASLSMQTISMVPAAVAQTLFSLVPVFVIPIAAIFFKERITPGIFVSAILAVAGVIVLIWRKELAEILFA
jgi:drug/metabolite transporter (DMT)-like permease